MLCFSCALFQLENRLLAELEASLPQSPSGPGRSTLTLTHSVADLADSSDDEGEPLQANPLEYNPANFSPASPGRSQKHLHERMGSRSKLTQIDPQAEEALIHVRRAQKERQAMISAALQTNNMPNTQRQLSVSGSQPNSQRTSTSNLSAAIKQR